MVAEFSLKDSSHAPWDLQNLIRSFLRQIDAIVTAGCRLLTLEPLEARGEVDDRGEGR